MSTPWFPMYPTDFLVSTATMTPAQGWAYTQLLMYAWTNGSVPDDRDACAALTRCPLTDADWQAVRARFTPMATPMAGPMATPIATLINPRMERERARVNERHSTAAENGRRGAEARWKRGNGVANGNPNSNANGNPNGETMATTTTTTTIDTTPLPPAVQRPTETRTIGGGKKAVREWKPDRAMAERFARRIPAWATKLERAEAGDLFRKLDDGSRFPVTVDEVLADAVADATERICTERATVIAKVEAKGLTPDEAHELWWRWWRDHTQGGDSPTVSLRNDLADKAVRNIAAVWRGRIAAEEFATAS